MSDEEDNGGAADGQPRKPLAERYLEANLTTDDVDCMVKNLVRYALFIEQKKVPLKRDEAIKKVMGEHGKAFGAILSRAQVVLRQLFGVQLVELPVRQKRGAGSSAVPDQNEKAGKDWVLLSIIPHDMLPDSAQWDKDREETGLLAVILALILVSGNTIKHDALYTYLRRLGVKPGQTEHPEFGDVDAVLASFTKHGYLDSRKTVTDEAANYEYVWGPRAKVEFKPENVMGFIMEISPSVSEASLRLALEM
ncbi:MAGE family-domain-containing protein [Zopfochytrium polystomum]|nr:MAGE family-domain-containing protein [Zopfochytrium polystomum]